MRKTILTGALVLFGAGTTLQLLVALAVCILWLALVANLKPYAESVDDRLAQVEGLQVLFTLLIGLVLQLQQASSAAAGEGAGAGGGAHDDVLLGLFLVAFNVIVVALAVAQQPIVRWAAWTAIAPLRARCCPDRCSCLDDDDAAAGRGARRAPTRAGGAGRTSPWAANLTKALPAGGGAGGGAGAPAPSAAAASAATLAAAGVATTAPQSVAPGAEQERAQEPGPAGARPATVRDSKDVEEAGRAEQPHDALAAEAMSILTSFRGAQ
jgi:hypothetical protein